MKLFLAALVLCAAASVANAADPLQTLQNQEAQSRPYSYYTPYGTSVRVQPYRALNGGNFSYYDYRTGATGYGQYNRTGATSMWLAPSHNSWGLTYSYPRYGYGGYGGYSNWGW